MSSPRDSESGSPRGGRPKPDGEPQQPGSEPAEPARSNGSEAGGSEASASQSSPPEASASHDAGSARLAGGFAPGHLVLGRYRLRELVGSGASADVWLAQDERLNRAIALKLLHPHLLPDAATRERFAAEARAVASVSHPGIVGIHDVVIEGRTAAIVFEYVRGESLDARLRRMGRLPPIEAAEIAAQIAEALAAAHAAGLVHRDVKPANVLLDASGRARLVDFGIAQVLGEARARLTRQGEVVGTLRSIAPEQLSGYAGAPAADLYALGTVMYEMLAGRPPYDATTPVALAEQQRRPPPPIPQAPPGLAALVLRCLQPDPAARPSSATEIAGYLRGWLAATTPGSGPADIRLPATPPLPLAVAAGAAAGQGIRGGPSQLRSGPLSPAYDPNAATMTGSRRRSTARRVGLAGLFLALAIVAGMATWPLLAALGSGTSPRPSEVANATSATPGLTETPALPTDTPTPEPTDTATPEPTDTPTPEPTDTPTPEPTDTPTPFPDSLAILWPQDGATVNSRQITVEGFAPPGSDVVRDMPAWFDDHATADAHGHWTMKASLNPGENRLSFYLRDQGSSTEQTITVYYQH